MKPDLSSAKKYQCVIFDWDGTLMDSEAKIVDAIQQAARKAGYPILPYDESKQIIGLSLEKAIEFLYPSVTPKAIQVMSAAYTQCFLIDSKVDMSPYPGVIELLEFIQQSGAKLAIATGKSRKGLEKVLASVSFDHYFDMTRTPQESESKPSPLMLQQILDEFGIDAEEAVMVGDTVFDMEMAQNINMDSVAMSHGVHELERLQQYNPVVSCDNLTELQTWLTGRLTAHSIM